MSLKTINSRSDTMEPVISINSIGSLPRNQWDEMAGDNVFASYGWLLTVEETFLKQLIPLYFLLQKDGEISGAAVCYIITRDIKIVSQDDLLFGRLKKFVNLAGASFLPAMVCCPLKAYGKHLFFKKGLDHQDKKKIGEKILNAIESDALKRKLPLSFPRVLKNEKTLIRQLLRKGYYKTIDLPRAFIDISWDSFDNYKKFIKKRSRNMSNNITKEINKNQRAGVNIGIMKTLNNHEKRLYSLLNENSLKYNKMSLPFQEDFLSQMEKNLGKDLIIYHSQKENRITGTGIMLKKDGAACIPFIGIDYALARNDATYFNMLFYQPIKDAINGDIHRIYFGNAMYKMKTRRGCKIENAFFFHKPCHAISKPTTKLWFCFHRYWYKKKFPYADNSDGN